MLSVVQREHYGVQIPEMWCTKCATTVGNMCIVHVICLYIESKN